MTTLYGLKSTLIAGLLSLFAAASASAELLVGWASADITPNRPVALAGQMHTRVSRGVHDPVTATVLAIETRQPSPEQAIMVSCDLVAIDTSLQKALEARVRKELPDFESRKLLLNATHTHAAPETRDGLYQIPPEVMQPPEYVAFAVDRIAPAITRAWRSRKPAGVSWALGQAVVGHNRRAMYADGGAKMYGKTDTADFRHIEGYEDHGVEMLFLWDIKNRLTGIVVNVACPSQVVASQYEISADFWHVVRELLRRRHSKELFVFAMTGASGDQSPHLLFRRRAEERLQERLGLSATEELARRIVNTVDYVLPAAAKDIRLTVPFRHQVKSLRLPVRKVTPEEAKLAKAEYERWMKAPASERARHRLMMRNKAVIDRYEHPGAEASYDTEIHVIRFGDIAIATNPFELYLDFGIQIKARSRAEQTFIAQLSGRGTYLPTARAVAAGGYGAEVASSVVGPEGGEILVERTVEAINSMWEK
jgi:hypothetical protein